MPSQKDWDKLVQDVAQMRKGSVASALKMREGWVRGGAPISEASGFNAIPAGARYSDGEFVELGTSVYFWEASGGNDAGAGYWNLINSRDELDEKFVPFLKRWKLERLPQTDRIILEIAVYEILTVEDIPTSVSINEAVKLAKKFGTSSSSSYINGVLSNFVKSL